jgi:hypothetical protein
MPVPSVTYTITDALANEILSKVRKYSGVQCDGIINKSCIGDYIRRRDARTRPNQFRRKKQNAARPRKHNTQNTFGISSILCSRCTFRSHQSGKESQYRTQKHQKENHNAHKTFEVSSIVCSCCETRGSSLVMLNFGDAQSLSTMAQNSAAAPASIWRETNSSPKSFSLIL